MGVVVIGRNEGARLRACLESIAEYAAHAVYVDSGSRDDSIAIAAGFGVDIVALDSSRPFSAGRARNEGFARLLAKAPSVRFVQFVDGDCVIAPGWICAGARTLAARPECAAVMGVLVERRAGASIYSRLCAMEWRRSPGDLENCAYLSGISMVRTQVFRELGGFRPEVIAGQDTELGVRMALAGHAITVIEDSMASHDADMTTFRQWWRRAVRAGHAIGQRFDIHGRSALRDCARERNSTLLWGVALPVAILIAAYPSRGASLWLLAAYPALGVRVWKARRRLGDSFSDALLYAGAIVVGKFANALGLIRFLLNKRRGRYRIIEWK